MAAEWYYQLVGVEIGPLASQELRQHAIDGNILSDTPVRKGRDGKWVVASKVKGLLDGIESPAPTPNLGPSLPGELVRRGWKPYRFKDSDVFVLLPEDVFGVFAPNGTLHGTEDAKTTAVSATLHPQFKDDRASAYDFVTSWAKKRDLEVNDVGTYRYCYDPTESDPNEVIDRFWVIAIPGSVVVVSLLGTRDSVASPVLEKIRAEIPCIVGELT